LTPRVFNYSGSCGFDANAIETVQYFCSPAYPYDYFNNLACYWNFFAPDNYVILLCFVDFNLANENDFVLVSLMVCYVKVWLGILNSAFSKCVKVLA